MNTLEPVSVALKFGFLAVLYLFLLWVVRSARRDLARGRAAAARAGRPAPIPPDATGLYSASALGGAARSPQRAPRLVVERAPGHDAGMIYDLDGDSCSAAATTPRSGSRTRSPPRATRASTSRATSS